MTDDTERMHVSWEITTLDEAMRVLHAIQRQRDTLSARLAEVERERDKWKQAFAAQSRKLQSVLPIKGVKEALAAIRGDDT